MSSYVDPKIIKEFAVAPEASPPGVWETLAAAASRMFDRAAEVGDNFFVKVPNSTAAAAMTFRGNGTRYLSLPPYKAGTIVTVEYDGETVGATDYREKDGYLIFDLGSLARVSNLSSDFERPAAEVDITVTAKWGFAEIPADVSYAVIEQALMIWRRRDAAFTDLSGVSTAAVQQQLSPTFALAAEKYREIYGGRSYFI